MTAMAWARGCRATLCHEMSVYEWIGILFWEKTPAWLGLSPVLLLDSVAGVWMPLNVLDEAIAVEKSRKGPY